MGNFATSGKGVNYASRLLLFGGTGSIGRAVNEYFEKQGWQVVIVSRQPISNDNQICWDPVAFTAIQEVNVVDALRSQGPYEAVCWAQGMNYSDSLYNFRTDIHTTVYQANVVYILNSLHVLLTQQLLKKPARLCIITPILLQ